MSAALTSSAIAGRLMSTFSAAPRAAASPRLAATARSLAAFTLLRPASDSIAARSSRQAATQASGASAAARAAVRIEAARVCRSSSVPRGSFMAAAYDPYAAASSSARSSRRSTRSSPAAPARACVPAWAAYRGRPSDRAATIATRDAPRAPVTAEALPPPGTGSADASRRTNSSRVRSRRRDEAASTTPPIVGAARGPASGPGVSVRRQANGEPGRARYRRARPGARLAWWNRQSRARAGGSPERPHRDATVLRRRALLVQAVDRPAPRAVLEGQRQAGTRRIHLEHGPRAGRHRICECLVADQRERDDRQALVSPRDLPRAAIEPICPDTHRNRFNADHRHVMTPFRRLASSAGGLIAPAGGDEPGRR